MGKKEASSRQGGRQAASGTGCFNVSSTFCQVDDVNDDAEEDEDDSAAMS